MSGPIRISPMGGGGISLLGALGAPDLAASGYVELELAVEGTARSYRSEAATFPEHGRVELLEGSAAPYRTRIVVRRPSAPSDCSGVVLLEWLNVSSGADTAPCFGFVAPEVLRRGHVWVGVSAQLAGIESAPALVQVDSVPLAGLRQVDPERYGSLHHPGDAHSYDIFTDVARALSDRHPDGPTSDLGPVRLVALGESQSAYTLSTYLDGVQPVEGVLDAALVHSRGGPIAPLDGPGGRLDLEADRGGPPVRLRDDLAVPVMIVQTETDVLGHLDYLPARQPDTDRLRLWEMAGTAHADRSLVGEFESLLGCSEPVNRGQQRFVLRAALRALVDWQAGLAAPAQVPRLEVESGPDGRRFVLDELGNATGGLRTPCVDAAVEVLSGLAPPGASHLCRLFGRTCEVPTELLRRRYPSTRDYLDAYAAALERSIEQGVLLAEDRDALLADARPELIEW